MWKEFLDPKTQIFFKDLQNAPEEKIDELIRFWEFIQERDKKNKALILGLLFITQNRTYILVRRKSHEVSYNITRRFRKVPL